MLQINRVKLNYKLLTILFTFSLSIKVFGQDESVTFSTIEVEQKDKKYKYSDIDQYEQVFLLKANLIGLQNVLSSGNTGILISSLGAEYKIFSSLSLDVEGMFPGSTNIRRIAWLQAGLRYYPSKRVGSNLKKDQVNNFSGRYLKLSYGAHLDRYNRSGNVPDGIELSYGRQQKVGRWGYLDIAGSVSYNRTFRFFNFSTKIAGGFAHGILKKTSNLIGKEKENTTVSWDSPIIIIDNLTLHISEKLFGTNASLAGEFHLSNYWTIRPSIGATYSYNGHFLDAGLNISNPSSYGYGGSLSIRKYINVRKRLQKGHEAKSFSGYYLSLNLPGLYSRYESFEWEGRSSNDSNGFYFRPNIGIGWQEKVGNRFLFNMAWRVGYYRSIKAVRTFAGVGIGILINK